VNGLVTLALLAGATQ